MSTRRQRWAAMATGRAAVPVRRDLRNCAPCRGKLLATMKAEIAQTAAHTLKPLNVKLQSRPDFIPAAPRTEVVKLPGHTVLYDVHSMAAVEVTTRELNSRAGCKASTSTDSTARRSRSSGSFIRRS